MERGTWYCLFCLRSDPRTWGSSLSLEIGDSIRSRNSELDAAGSTQTQRLEPIFTCSAREPEAVVLTELKTQKLDATYCA